MTFSIVLYDSLKNRVVDGISFCRRLSWPNWWPFVPTFVPTFIFDHRNTVFLSTRNASKTPVISMKFRLPPQSYVVQIPLPQPSSRTKKDIYAKNPEVSTVSSHRYTMCHGGTVGTGKSKTQAHAFEFASCFLHKDRAWQEQCRLSEFSGVFW